MGLIWPGREDLLDFLKLRHVLWTYSGSRSGGLRKGQSPCELLGGLWPFLSRRCRGLRPFVESVPEHVDSSPVLTWILRRFWSLPRGVSPRLEWGHARAFSSRAVAAVSRFPSHGSKHLWLSLEAFPRGFPTRLSHRAVPRATPWCESILGLNVEAVRGKQVSVEWTETSGGLWEWWHDPGVPVDFLWRGPRLKMRWEHREFFPDHAGKGSLLSS